MSKYWLMVAFILGGILGSGGINVPVAALCALALAILAIVDQRERHRAKT